MSQRQYTTFQADILSFELRDALLGTLKPGRYMGYDTMAEYQAQAADNVYCRFTHPAGMNKYDQASPPALEAQRGVAITTQGTIIAEDGNVDVTVTLINGGASDTVVHLLYMEHVYDGAVPGANNATYGIKSGTEGGGVPSLTSPTKQVVIGTIIEPAGATQFSHLVYHLSYPGLGDEDLYKTLFKSSALGEIALGNMPSSNEGIIGNRDFTTSDYLANWSTLTKALTDLDVAVKARADAITALANTKLDDWATPDNNADLDATTARHGLLKKLPDDATKYLNGVGNWAIPSAGFIFIGSAANYHYNSSLRGGTITMGTTYQLDISNEVPGGYDQALIIVTMQCYWGGSNSSGRYGVAIFSKGGTSNDRYYMEGPKPLSSTALNGSPGYIYHSEQILVELNSSRIMQIAWGNRSGSTTDWMYDIQIKVQAYR